MKESELKVYKFSAFCSPSCQTIGASPVSRKSFVNLILSFHFSWLLKGVVHLKGRSLWYTTLFALSFLIKVLEKASGVSVLLGSLPKTLVL